MKLDVLKTRSCIVLKEAIMKNFVANENHSFKFVSTFSIVVVDLPTDCIWSFLFPAENDILVPVFSQSTEVVVANFVVILKFPNIWCHTVSLVYPNFVCFVDCLSLFSRKKNKINPPIRKRKASAHLKFSLVACNTIEL